MAPPTRSGRRIVGGSPSSRSMESCGRSIPSGGPPVTICTAGNGKGARGATADGSSSPRRTTPRSTSCRRGAAVRCRSPRYSRTSRATGFPTWLPTGGFSICAFVGRTEGDRVMVGSIGGRGPTGALAAASNTAISGDHLLFMREGTLMAQPFDQEATALVGDAARRRGRAVHRWRPARRVLGLRHRAADLQHGPVEIRSEIVWVDQAGRCFRSSETGDLLFDIMVSPDGRFAAVTELESAVGTADIFVCDLERKLRTRFTFEPTNDWYPAWSPDDRRIAFASAETGPTGYGSRRSAGRRMPSCCWRSTGKQLYPQAWSPDGEWLVYERTGADNNRDLCAVRPADGQTIELVVQGSTRDLERCRPTADGWPSRPTNPGMTRSTSRPFRNRRGGGRSRRTVGPSREWSRDGRELFFASVAGELSVAEVTGAGETFDVGRVRGLHSWHLATTFRRPYDVGANAEELLVIRGLTTPEA